MKRLLRGKTSCSDEPKSDKISHFERLLTEKSIIVPTFDTKVTEYLCSRWVFFSSDKFRLFN